MNDEKSGTFLCPICNNKNCDTETYIGQRFWLYCQNCHYYESNLDGELKTLLDGRKMFIDLSNSIKQVY